MMIIRLADAFTGARRCRQGARRDAAFARRHVRAKTAAFRQPYCRAITHDTSGRAARQPRWPMSFDRAIGCRKKPRRYGSLFTIDASPIMPGYFSARDETARLDAATYATAARPIGYYSPSPLSLLPLPGSRHGSSAGRHLYRVSHSDGRARCLHDLPSL